MQKTINCVGKTEAIRLVSEAYNSEILTNRIGRIEATVSKFMKSATPSADLLLKALERVTQVCELSES